MENNFWDNYCAFTTDKGNIIWAAAMQLAWNQLRSKFTSNQPLILETNNKVALKSIVNLNNSNFKRQDISEKSIYVKCGYGQQTLNIINKQVAEKFSEKTIPPLQYKLKPTDIISYAYLFKKIIFPIKFERRKQKQFKFKGQKVSSFYAKQTKQKQQIFIHQYKDEDTFIAQISDQFDSIFLIKNKKVTSIDQAINLATKADTLNQKIKLQKGDYFQMPVIKINEQRSYDQLIGLPFINEQLKDYMIGVMKEVIKLDINQSGAKVQNQAVMVLNRCRAISKNQPKNIILNNDFWIVMKQKNHHPYICLFINSL